MKTLPASVLLFVGCALLAPTTSYALTGPCGVYSVAYNVPTGYGAAYNLHFLTRELLLQSQCETARFLATGGSPATSQSNFIVYTPGYRWDGSKWASYSLVPNGGNLQVAYNPPPPTVPDGFGRSVIATDIPYMCEKKNYTVTGGKTTTVNSEAKLKSALASASAGDTIILGSGSYGIDIRSGLQYSGYVAIKGSPGAKVTKMFLKGAKNLQLDSINFEYGSATGQEAWKPKVLEIQDSENIMVVNSNIIGNPKGTLLAMNMPEAGARFLGIKNLVFANNNVGYVERGLINQWIDGFLFEHNVLENVGYDGFMNQHLNNGAFQSNFFPSGLRNGGSDAHPDYFQFDGGSCRHGIHPGKNIVIRGNVMLGGERGQQCKPGDHCNRAQGIFVANACGYYEGKEHIFENITITDNVYCSSGINGIVVGIGGRNITIKNNAHYTCPRPEGDDKMSQVRGVAGNPQSGVIDVSNNATGRVSGDKEAIAKAKQLPWLNNCILKGLYQ